MANKECVGVLRLRLSSSKSSGDMHERYVPRFLTLNDQIVRLRSLTRQLLLLQHLLTTLPGGDDSYRLPIRMFTLVGDPVARSSCNYLQSS